MDNVTCEQRFVLQTCQHSRRSAYAPDPASDGARNVATSCSTWHMHKRAGMMRGARSQEGQQGSRDEPPTSSTSRLSCCRSIGKNSISVEKPASRSASQWTSSCKDPHHSLGKELDELHLTN